MTANNLSELVEMWMLPCIKEADCPLHGPTLLSFLSILCEYSADTCTISNCIQCLGRLPTRRYWPRGRDFGRLPRLICPPILAIRSVFGYGTTRAFSRYLFVVHRAILRNSSLMLKRSTHIIRKRANALVLLPRPMYRKTLTEKMNVPIYPLAPRPARSSFRLHDFRINVFGLLLLKTRLRTRIRRGNAERASGKDCCS